MMSANPQNTGFDYPDATMRPRLPYGSRDYREEIERVKRSRRQVIALVVALLLVIAIVVFVLTFLGVRLPF